MSGFSRLAMLLCACTTAACTAHAQGWRASGVAYDFFPSSPAYNEASVALTITQADGLPVNGLTQNDFFLYGVCGIATMSPAVTTVSITSISGDYILKTKVPGYDLGQCRGFVVKVLKGPIAAAATNQKLSIFIEFKR